MVTSAVVLLLAGLAVRAYLRDQMPTAAGLGMATIIFAFLLLA